MSNSAVIRPLRLPPPDFGHLKVPGRRLPARTWYRVHPGNHDAIHFSLNPGHRFSHPQCPYPLLYLGADIDTCLFERFGGLLYQQATTLSVSLWRANPVSAIKVPALEACDLTQATTLSALRVDLSSLMHHDLATPQQWGLAIQEHPGAFRAIRYASRFNGRPCLALFQRDAIERHLSQTRDETLVASDAAADWLRRHQIRLY